MILVKLKDGKREKWKDLTKVWQLKDDKAGFIQYVQRETRSLLAEPASANQEPPASAGDRRT